MHGLGNDFIVIDGLKTKLSEPVAFAKKYCDRHFGIGADQLLIVDTSDKADFTMRIYNADGSEVEMCGNGIRCVAKFIHDMKLSAKTTFAIETLAGIMYPELVNGNVTVNMGRPVLHPDKIPVLMDGESVIQRPINIGSVSFNITAVSMGNPHCVIFVDDPGRIDLKTIGPDIENHIVFPNRTNVEFVTVTGEDEIMVKVWERGSGITLACGTGACASAVAAVLNNKTGRNVTVHLPGGTLQIEWLEEGPVFMTGPAETVFTGTVEI